MVLCWWLRQGEVRIQNICGVVWVVKTGGSGDSYYIWYGVGGRNIEGVELTKKGINRVLTTRHRSMWGYC